MKEFISKMYGTLRGHAIEKGMKSETHPYNFGDFEVKCWVEITEEGVSTEFAVFKEYFQDWDKAIYTTNSFKELRKWLEEHKNEIN